MKVRIGMMLLPAMLLSGCAMDKAMVSLPSEALLMRSSQS
jgi:hypothetical protein